MFDCLYFYSMHCYLWSLHDVARESVDDLRMREKLGKRMRKRGGKARKSTTALYMKREKLPLEPDATRTGVHGKLQHFRPDHDRVWRRGVQVSVTEIVDVLYAENFVPTKNHAQRVSIRGTTTWNYSLLLYMTRNHLHREVLSTKRAAIIKPCHRHHIPNVFSFDGTCGKNEPFQIGDTLLVKANRMKDLGMHRMEYQSSNTAKSQPRR